MSDYLPFLGAVVVAAITSYFTYKSSTRVARDTAAAAMQVKNVEVDAAAYDRARRIYESGIAQLEEQINRLRQQVDQERDSSQRLRDQVVALEDVVAELRRQLIRAGVNVAAAHMPNHNEGSRP